MAVTKLNDRIPSVDVPEGEKGPWKIERFEVSKEDSDFTRFSAMKYGRGYVQPGTYTRLSCRGYVVMSDTRDEKRDHYAPVREASLRGGRVLIAGLGVGMVLNAILRLPNVEHVTVIEQSQDVIDLVADHYYEKFGHDRLTIIKASIYDWKPKKGERWTVAWFDVWNSLNEDNLKTMATLNRRFARRTDWKGCWGQEILRARRDRRRSY